MCCVKCGYVEQDDRYLAANGKERLAGRVHEKDLASVAMHIVIHSENQISVGI